VTTEVRHTATQRAGLRGVGFEVALFAVYLGVVPVVSRAAGGAPLWFALAVGAVLVRLALYSGPHLRGVQVTTTQFVAGRIAVPLADVVDVEVVDRRELRRRSHADEVAHESVPPGPTEAVVLRAVSPEGAHYAFGAAVDGAAGLRDHLDRARAQAAPAVVRARHPLPFSGTQGVDRGIAAGALLVAVALDALVIALQGWPVGATVVLGLLVLRSARRRVVVDGTAIRSGRIELRWTDVEHVRLVPLAEARLLPCGRSLLPLWAPPWVLVVVRRRPTDAPVERRTVLVGVPEPLELPATTGGLGGGRT
jgi:hypothetical protein